MSYTFTHNSCASYQKLLDKIPALCLTLYLDSDTLCLGASVKLLLSVAACLILTHCLCHNASSWFVCAARLSPMASRVLMRPDMWSMTSCQWVACRRGCTSEVTGPVMTSSGFGSCSTQRRALDASLCVFLIFVSLLLVDFGLLLIILFTLCHLSHSVIRNNYPSLTLSSFVHLANIHVHLKNSQLFYIIP